MRLRSGLYKGDLARVVDLDPGAQRATVRIVPRLDYAGLAARRAEDGGRGGAGGSAAGGGGANNFGKAPKVRPPARAFNPEEARAQRLDVAQQRDRGSGDVYYVLGGSQRFLGGYLVKGVSTRGLAREEALPPLDELQRFNAVRPGGLGWWWLVVVVVTGGRGAG